MQMDHTFQVLRLCRAKSLKNSFVSLAKSQNSKFYVSSSLISTQLHIFAKFSMATLFMNLVLFFSQCFFENVARTANWGVERCLGYCAM